MNTRLLTGRLAWSIPIAAGALVVGAAVLPQVASGSSSPVLPGRSAAQLVADVAKLSPPELSGTVVATSRLGLPQLPSAAGDPNSLSLASFATGSHTVRVWLDGPHRQRFAVVGQLAETDLVRSGRQVWVYSSGSGSATHYTLRSAHRSAHAPLQTGATPQTPLSAARQALTAIGPTTAVSVDRTAWVAGRPAYQLVLTPKDSRTLVSHVTIAIDSSTHVPLRVQVFGANPTTPAFEVGFTHVSFTAPSPRVFAFQPPPGTTVTNGKTPGLSGARPGAAAAQPRGTGARVLGHGWSAVLELPVGVNLLRVGSGSAQLGQLSGLLMHASTTVPNGRLLSTTLVSALLTNDGHLYVGAVPPAVLQQVAATDRAR